MNAWRIHRYYVKLFSLSAILFLCFDFSYSQPGLPPRNISVTATQALNFGGLCVTGTGGTVMVGWNGTRTSSGGITLLSSLSASPAILQIKLCQGRSIIMTFDPVTTLTGNTGGTLRLDIGPTEKGPSGSGFFSNGDCNFITLLRVGGTLHLPGTTIAGTYTGTFAITFNEQ
jgi:hypothetical protein